MELGCEVWWEHTRQEKREQRRSRLEEQLLWWQRCKKEPGKCGSEET